MPESTHCGPELTRNQVCAGPLLYNIRCEGSLQMFLVATQQITGPLPDINSSVVTILTLTRNQVSGIR